MPSKYGNLPTVAQPINEADWESWARDVSFAINNQFRANTIEVSQKTLTYPAKVPKDCNGYVIGPLLLSSTGSVFIDDGATLLIDRIL